MSRILVKKLLPAKNVSKSGLILPESKNIRYGLVVEVGPGVHNDEGKLVKPNLEKGQYVLLPEYGGSSVPKSDPKQEEEYVFYQDTDILGVVDGLDSVEKRL
jgi:chaperonin GroES